MEKTLKKIMCVDDEEDIRDILSYMFENEGYEVITCSGGEEGLKKAVSFQPNLIVLDVMMPNVDGIETLKELKVSPDTNQIPVVFLTAKTLPSELEQLKKLEVLAVFTKPFDPLSLPKELLALWNNYVNKGDSKNA